jgi:phage baseplate assembly protein W
VTLPAPLLSWPLLAVPNDAGRLVFPSLEQSVRERIEVILRTRPGEQLMWPEFGGGIEEFLQQPNTLTTRRRLHDRVREALERWEPRILLDRVDVQDVPDQPSHLRVEIGYRLRRTDALHPMAITLQLES